MKASSRSKEKPSSKKAQFKSNDTTCLLPAKKADDFGLPPISECDQATTVRQALLDLLDRCWSLNPCERPLFEDSVDCSGILSVLQSVSKMLPLPNLSKLIEQLKSHGDEMEDVRESWFSPGEYVIDDRDR